MEEASSSSLVHEFKKKVSNKIIKKGVFIFLLINLIAKVVFYLFLFHFYSCRVVLKNGSILPFEE
jgi:hypothetical protein